MKGRLLTLLLRVARLLMADAEADIAAREGTHHLLRLVVPPPRRHTRPTLRTAPTRRRLTLARHAAAVLARAQ